MDFDPELVGWMSVAESVEDLYNWFTEEEILTMQEHGYFIHVYESEDFKFYDRFKHFVMCQSNMKLIKIIKL